MLIVFLALVALTSVAFFSCGGDSVDEKGSLDANDALRIRVGSFNIAHCRFVGFDVSRIADAIIAQELDIVGLQEVDRWASRSEFIDTVELLKQKTGYEYCVYAKAINLEGDQKKYGTQGEYGTAILSRYPIISSETVMLTSDGREQRVVGRAEIELGDETVTVFNTHLSYESPELRKKQFAELESLTDSCERSIVLGDFNVDTPAEFELLPLGKVNSESTPMVTFPSEKLAIDNIYYSDELALISGGVENSDISDHYILYAELELKKAE